MAGYKQQLLDSGLSASIMKKPVYYLCKLYIVNSPLE